MVGEIIVGWRGRNDWERGFGGVMRAFGEVLLIIRFSVQGCFRKMQAYMLVEPARVSCRILSYPLLSMLHLVAFTIRKKHGSNYSAIGCN